MHFLFTLLFNKSVLPGLGLAISLFPTGWGWGKEGDKLAVVGFVLLLPLSCSR